MKATGRSGAALGLMVVILVAALAALWSGPRTAEVHTVGSPEATPAPVGRTGAFSDRGGTASMVFPDTKLGLGAFVLDQPLQPALTVLGPPMTTEPDMFGTAHTWVLPSGVRFTLSVWGDTDEISGLYALVPPGGSVGVEAFGGVAIGVSTLTDVVTAWGPRFTAATSSGDDYVVSYVECVGPYPVVVKFDQAAATAERFAPVAGSPLWNQPVTSMLVAYADDPPGSAGCPSPHS